MNKGKFITIYGINNIGKSTHSLKLVEHLKAEGYDAVYLKYPIYDLAPTGPRLNDILRHSQQQNLTEEELQTLFVQNRKDFEPQLQAMLAEGKIIIAEDYIGTGIAWGMAKGLSQSLLEDMNKNLVHEDLSILFTGKRNLQVREDQHLHEQNDDLVQKVAAILADLGQKYGWKVVEVQPTIEATAKILRDVVLLFLKN